MPQNFLSLFLAKSDFKIHCSSGSIEALLDHIIEVFFISFDHVLTPCEHLPSSLFFD